LETLALGQLAPVLLSKSNLEFFPYQ
jgi:hypothetical protein